MFTAYIRLPQDGIEPLTNMHDAEKDTASSHYFFEDCRIALQYYLNKKERTSGMTILLFGPNGNIWCETGLYCEEYNELISYYCGIDLSLKEAEKCKAKNIEIFIPNNRIVKLLSSKQPFKEEPYRKVHEGMQQRWSIFSQVRFTHRTDYPESVLSRLQRESMNASEPPQITPQGRWSQKINLSYYNLYMSDEETKLWAKQYASLMWDWMENYMKEYERDYGKEALRKLHADLKEKKIDDLPPLKRNLKETRASVVLKTKQTPFKKTIQCQHCSSPMKLERVTLEKPEDVKYFLMRCPACYATKTLNEKGRLLSYGKYDKSK